MGKVTMFHPPSGVTQDASRDAFDRVYREQGWELVDNPAPQAEDDDLAAARSEADELGVSYHPRAKAETIRKAIDEHKAAQED